MKTVTPLPTLGANAHKIITDSLQPDLISQSALNKLHTLGFGDKAVQKILNWIISGQISRPQKLKPLSPASAAHALIEDNEIYTIHEPTPDRLAQYVTMMYLHHDTFMRLDKANWLAELVRLAGVKLPSIPDIYHELEQHVDAQWILLDGFASVLVAPLKQPIIKLLCDWSPPTCGWAQVKAKTTTDNHYQSLLSANVKHSLHKINAIDKLIRQKRYPIEELIQCVVVELTLSMKQHIKKLDPSKPVFLFADHGFRISPDGKRYQHGGDSWLERMVPMWRFEVK